MEGNTQTLSLPEVELLLADFYGKNSDGKGSGYGKRLISLFASQQTALLREAYDQLENKYQRLANICGEKEHEAKQTADRFADTAMRLAKENIKFEEENKRLREALAESVEIMRLLEYYGVIHTVTGVVCPEGTHGNFINKATKFINEYRTQLSTTNGKQG